MLQSRPRSTRFPPALQNVIDSVNRQTAILARPLGGQAHTENLNAELAGLQGTNGTQPLPGQVANENDNFHDLNAQMAELERTATTESSTDSPLSSSASTISNTENTGAGIWAPHQAAARAMSPSSTPGPSAGRTSLRQSPAATPITRVSSDIKTAIDDFDAATTYDNKVATCETLLTRMESVLSVVDNSSLNRQFYSERIQTARNIQAQYIEVLNKIRTLTTNREKITTNRDINFHIGRLLYFKKQIITIANFLRNKVKVSATVARAQGYRQALSGRTAGTHTAASPLTRAQTLRRTGTNAPTPARTLRQRVANAFGTAKVAPANTPAAANAPRRTLRQRLGNAGSAVRQKLRNAGRACYGAACALGRTMRRSNKVAPAPPAANTLQNSAAKKAQIIKSIANSAGPAVAWAHLQEAQHLLNTGKMGQSDFMEVIGAHQTKYPPPAAVAATPTKKTQILRSIANAANQTAAYAQLQVAQNMLFAGSISDLDLMEVVTAYKRKYPDTNHTLNDHGQPKVGVGRQIYTGQARGPAPNHVRGRDRERWNYEAGLSPERYQTYMRFRASQMPKVPTHGPGGP